MVQVPKALDDMKRVGMWMSRVIEPGFVAESDGVND